MACVWFLIGTAVNGPTTWVRHYKLQDQGCGVQYIYSLHWSLTQFTPASMRVGPQNSLERTFNVVLIICAMVYFSTFVGGITADMTRLRSIKSSELAQTFL